MSEWRLICQSNEREFLSQFLGLSPGEMFWFIFHISISFLLLLVYCDWLFNHLHHHHHHHQRDNKRCPGDDQQQQKMRNECAFNLIILFHRQSFTCVDQIAAAWLEIPSCSQCLVESDRPVYRCMWLPRHSFICWLYLRRQEEILWDINRAKSDRPLSPSVYKYWTTL